MLLTRGLPPQFLLPAWSTQHLVRVTQRAHQHRTARRSSPSRSSRSLGETRDPPNRKTQKRPKQPSLFDELFPEEKQDEAERELDKLPVFNWKDDLKLEAHDNSFQAREDVGSWLHNAPPRPPAIREPSRTGDIIQKEKKQRTEATVLVLNAATNTLEESDFFRLSARGEHIEGWTSGIIKIIPGRDESTLEHLGHYFILFSSEAAARAYSDQTKRLHKLAKTHSRSDGLSLPPPPGLLKEGEDLRTLLQGFSLVPGQSKLSLRLINRPYRPAMLRILNEGGAAAIADRLTRGEDMVLFSLDNDNLTHFDVKIALRKDGLRRNLHWGLSGDPDEAIVELKDEKGREDSPAGYSMEQSAKHTNGGHYQRKSVARRPTRFIISFKDRDESRRFVREWHRRLFPLEREHRLGNDPSPIVNAQILW